jgi:hypothetical protein
MDGIPAREFYILRKRIIFVIWYFFEAGAPNVPLSGTIGAKTAENEPNVPVFGTIGAKTAENDANVPLFGTIGALRGDINLFWGKNIFRVVKSK